MDVQIGMEEEDAVVEEVTKILLLFITGKLIIGIILGLGLFMTEFGLKRVVVPVRDFLTLLRLKLKDVGLTCVKIGLITVGMTIYRKRIPSKRTNVYNIEIDYHFLL